MPTSVTEYVLGRLKAIGIHDIFDVPGDFAFTVQDAIVNYPGINWIGCCNELNSYLEPLTGMPEFAASARCRPALRHDVRRQVGR
jgi:hypothetical protein